MSAYVELQEAEFASEARRLHRHPHQREVGTGYFDRVATALNPDSATLALVGIAPRSDTVPTDALTRQDDAMTITDTGSPPTDSHDRTHTGQIATHEP